MIQKNKVVAVSGYFNPIHRGHIELFNEAKKLGDKLLVIVNNDKQVVLKGSTPFMDEEERCFIVGNCKAVDEVVLSIDNDKSICKTLEKVRPDIFANGGDRKSNNIPEYALCEELSIMMVFDVGGEKTQSSSSLLAKIKRQN